VIKTMAHSKGSTLRTVLLLYALLLFAVLTSCASNPRAYAKIDEKVQHGEFDEAVAALDARRKVRGTIYSARNNLLFYLDRGMVLHYADRFSPSFTDLHNAERLIEEAFTRSITQEIGTFLLNDNVREYRGEDYEDLYINVFNALNFHGQNNLESALVEIRRMNEKLNVLADRYQRAARRVVESNEHLDPRQLPIESSRFSNSALARYMGVLFHRARGNPDSARIDHQELLQAFRLAPNIYNHPIPSSIQHELSIPPDMARLNVIAFTGLSPIKVERNILIPLPFAFPNNSARIAIPVMIERAQTVTRTEVLLSSGQSFRLELLENMSAVAMETFKSSQGLTILKTSARVITKAAASAIAAQRTRREQGDGLGLLAGALGRVLTEVSESADIRISRYFPSRALVGGINVPPGTYTVTVNFYGRSGLIKTESSTIQIQTNSLNLLRFVCPR